MGQLPCECLFTYSLALTVKTDTAADLLLWFVPSPFLNIFFSSLHGYCQYSCNAELNLITKGKDLNVQALLGKDHAGKPSKLSGKSSTPPMPPPALWGMQLLSTDVSKGLELLPQLSPPLATNMHHAKPLVFIRIRLGRQTKMKMSFQDFPLGLWIK